MIYLCTMSAPKRILVVTATVQEMSALVEGPWSVGIVHDAFGAGVDAMVTGVGLTATAYHLGKTLAEQSYSRAIMLGIAGSFSSNYPPGSIVEIVSETFGDLGADDNGDFLDIFQLGLAEAGRFPFSAGRIDREWPFGDFLEIPGVRGSSVNTVHGERHAIERFIQRSDAEVESMEGAAFFYACKMAGVPFRQFRAISNFVTARDRSAWKIAEAKDALGRFFREYRETLFNG